MVLRGASSHNLRLVAQLLTSPSALRSEARAWGTSWNMHAVREGRTHSHVLIPGS